MSQNDQLEATVEFDSGESLDLKVAAILEETDKEISRRGMEINTSSARGSSWAAQGWK